MLSMSSHFAVFYIIIGLFAHASQSQITELYDGIDLKKDGVPWLVEFYAPWCGHCRHLEPIYQQVYLTLKSSDIRVAKVDATRHTDLAAQYNIRGFPTIKFIQGDKVYTHRGDRSREAIVEFANRANGPLIRPVPTSSHFTNILTRHTDSVFFIFIGELDQHNDLYVKYKKVAEKFAVFSYFYSGSREVLPQTVRLKADPAVIVFKDDSHIEFSDLESGKTKASLSDWINNERFRSFPQVTSGTFSELSGIKKKLVIVVVNPTEAEISNKVKKAAELMATKKSEYKNLFQFVWMQESDMVNNIAMTTVSLPNIIVLDVQTQHHFWPNFHMTDITTEKFANFLDDIIQDKAPMHGGNGVGQRIKRLIYEIWHTIYSVYAQSIWLALIMFGIPTLAISVILYALCCLSSGEENPEEMMASDDDDEDSLDGQKYNVLPKEGSTGLHEMSHNHVKHD